METLTKLTESEFNWRIESNDNEYWAVLIDRKAYPRVWQDNITDGSGNIISESSENIALRNLPLSQKDWEKRFFGATIQEAISAMLEYVVTYYPESRFAKEALTRNALTNKLLPPPFKLVLVKRNYKGQRSTYLAFRDSRPLSVNPDPSRECYWYGKRIDEVVVDPIKTFSEWSNNFSDITVESWAPLADRESEEIITALHNQNDQLVKMLKDALALIQKGGKQ